MQSAASMTGRSAVAAHSAEGGDLRLDETACTEPISSAFLEPSICGEACRLLAG
jgi:hypothetical protein